MKMKFIKTNSAMYAQRRIHLITKRNLKKIKIWPVITFLADTDVPAIKKRKRRTKKIKQ